MKLLVDEDNDLWVKKGKEYILVGYAYHPDEPNRFYATHEKVNDLGGPITLSKKGIREVHGIKKEVKL